MLNIQWYPGHMAVGKRIIAENIKRIGLILEIVDARCIASSRNFDLNPLLLDKPRLVLINKIDLAEPGITAIWEKKFKNEDIPCLTIQAATGKNFSRIISFIKKFGYNKIIEKRGIRVKPILRVLVAGIPNVGKSTVINHLSGSNKTKTGYNPGVTRAKQWIQIEPGIEILDTPGIFFPKVADMETGIRLALLHSVPDRIIDVEKLGKELINLLRKFPDRFSQFEKSIKVEFPDNTLSQEEFCDNLFQKIADQRGFSVKGVYDADKVGRWLLNLFRKGKLGRFSLEKPEGLNIAE